MSLLLSLLQEAAFKRKLKENKEIHPPSPSKTILIFQEMELSCPKKA